MPEQVTKFVHILLISCCACFCCKNAGIVVYFRIPERMVFMGGMIIMAMGFLIWLPYAGHPTIGELVGMCMFILMELLLSEYFTKGLYFSSLITQFC